MARKLDPEKRQMFMDAAMRLFVEKGIGGSSTAQIAKEAGTASGTLFLYFPTKQNLIDELVLAISRDQSEFIRNRLKPRMSVQEQFEVIWFGSLEWFEDHMLCYRFQSLVRDSSSITPEIVEKTAADLSYYFEVISRGLAEKVLEPYPFELCGRMLYQNIVAVMDLIQITEDKKAIEAYKKTGFEIYWKGIKAKEIV